MDTRSLQNEDKDEENEGKRLRNLADLAGAGNEEAEKDFDLDLRNEKEMEKEEQEEEIGIGGKRKARELKEPSDSFVSLTPKIVRKKRKVLKRKTHVNERGYLGRSLFLDFILLFFA